MEVTLDSSTGQMDEEGGKQHLSDGYGMPRDSASGVRDCQPYRTRSNQSTKKNRRPYIQMNFARSACPRCRRNHKRDYYSGNPFAQEKPGEQAIGAFEHG